MAKDRKAERAARRERLRARTEEKERKRGGRNYIKIPTGVEEFEVKGSRSTLDIIPYEVNATNHPAAEQGELWYERTFFLHREIGADNGSYICPLLTFKKPCPICEYRKTLMDQDYNANKELIGDLKPKERQLFNIIDRNKDDKPMLFEMSYYLFGKLLDKEIQEGRDENADFMELEEGQMLTIRWEENKSFDNPFYEADRIDFDPRPDDYDEAILDEVVDLDACLIEFSYEDLEKIFLEESVGSEELPDEKTTSRRTTRRSEPEPEEEPEKPTRSRRSRGQQAKEEPEPEPEKQEAGPGECPGGGVFGDDCEKLDHCAECEVWEDCRDKADEDKAKTPGRRRR